MLKTKNFVSIDFETANHNPNSACSFALVRVEDFQIVEEIYHLIRPPRKDFVFTELHGITWEDVCNEPRFAELWPTMKAALKNIDFIAAHNATFDETVLRECCRHSRISPPAIPFKCTVELARTVWHIYPTTLPDVCRHLKIPLRHHHAAADAFACAQIVIKAAKRNIKLI
ncbi:MAG: exonuclease domain-containing protein [Thermodesulfobacteriota bacterium]